MVTKLQEVADTDVFTGRVDAINHIEVRARVNGFVETRGFEEGATVKEGEVLFEIEPDAYEAALTQIKGQIESAKAEDTLANIELERQRKLFKSGTVAESIVQRAEAEQGQVQGQILQLQGSKQEAELNLSYTKVIAPFAGRVGLTEISVGAYVGPDTGSLVILSSIDPIYVTFPVPESVLLDYRKKVAEKKVSSDVVATLTLANGQEYAEKGKIAIVDVAVQQGTDTVLIRSEFPNPNGALLDGQLVDIKLSAASTEKSITVPVVALQRDQGGYFVFIVDKDDKVERKNITVGQITGPTAVVEAGLKEGEKVVTEGIQRIHPGVVVDAQAAGDQPKKK
ncbi:MAG: efflux RND transporter periplasmic adaptor subunit [Pseudomonadota bacterium]